MVYKKLALVFVVAIMGVVMIGCKKQYVDFYINNASNNDIVIRYHPTGSTDTTDVHMYPYYHQYTIIYHSVDPSSTDWTSNYQIYIESVKTLAGDTINFDPNVEGRWTYHQKENSHYYQLTIDDNSF